VFYNENKALLIPKKRKAGLLLMATRLSLLSLKLRMKKTRSFPLSDPFCQGWKLAFSSVTVLYEEINMHQLCQERSCT